MERQKGREEERGTIFWKAAGILLISLACQHPSFGSCDQPRCKLLRYYSRWVTAKWLVPVTLILMMPSLTWEAYDILAFGGFRLVKYRMTGGSPVGVRRRTS